MPQPKREIHYNTLYKEISKKRTEGVSVKDLAVDLDIDQDSPDLERAINILVRQGKITRMIGLTREKHVGIVLQVKDDAEDVRAGSDPDED